jgi:medium-chain acyl-[acyl-carrier-protein] hydrolase
MKKSQSTWFENLPGGRDGGLRLYCFPYAGGSAQVFRGWQRHFAPQAALSLARLPGRDARIGEPPLKRYKPLVNALADALIPELPPVFAFWGHSMGALISFELARELRRRGKPAPLALFLSGRGAPQIPDPDPPIFNLPEPEFISQLRRLNGTPRELLDSAELKEFFLPTIRADFELVETYEYEPETPLTCAICAYGGLQDSDVPAANLKEWQKQTSGAFKVRMFPGDHFYIHSSTDLLHALQRDVFDLVRESPTGYQLRQQLNS